MMADKIVEDMIDRVVDSYREIHPTMGEMELWQLIKSKKVNGKSIPPHEVAASLRRTKPE